MIVTITPSVEQVHWSRSYKRVSRRVCQNQEHISIFQHLASKIERLERKEDVLLVFKILAGEEEVSSGYRFFSDTKLKEAAKNVTNSAWSKAKHWKEWWTRERHLRK